jgi:predicted nucleic acid-binding protein
LKKSGSVSTKKAMVKSSKLRVLVDANVLFSSVIWPRWPYAVLQHAVAGDYQLVLSDRIIAEARRAIERTAPAALDRFASLLDASQYEAAASPTDEDIAANLHLSRDPKDIHVGLAGIRAEVDYLVSLDKDLTAEDAPVREHLQVLLPAVFLRDYMGWSSEKLEAIRHRTWQEMEPGGEA